MNKLNLSIVMLLASSLSLACGSKTPAQTGGAGTGGGAGTSGGGTTGAGGGDSCISKAALTLADGGLTDAFPAMSPDGKCAPGAFAHDGICACQSDTPTVCSAGCTNTMTDDDNCGACGNACPATATCNAGTCGPAVVNVVPAAAGCGVTVGNVQMGLNIAVGGSTLYFSDAAHGTVKSVPVAGGTPMMISSTEKAPSAIAVNGTTVLWINSVTASLAGCTKPVIKGTIRKSVGGAMPTDLVSATNPSGGIRGFVMSADGASVYFSTDTNIKKIPVAGGAAVDVAIEEHGGLPGAIALEGTKIAYGTDLNGDVDVITEVAGTIARCGMNDPVTGELDPAKQINCLRVARSQGSLFLGVIAEKPNRVFWIDGQSVKANNTGAGATANNDTLANATGDVKAMAATATTIYFGEDGFIEKVPAMAMATQPPIIHIARGQMKPSSIALDATKAYWSTGDCAINSTGL